MANLVSTSVVGNITGNSFILDNSTDMSEWYKLSHCICPESGPSDCLGTGLAYLHVRTPLPTKSADGMGWNPYILEVVGYHTYSAECFHDFKAIVNTNNDNNTFYGSQVRINRSGAGGLMTPASNPYVYESATTYGGKNRLCFAVRKVSCCCTGYLWVRWWTNAGKRTDYSWATFHSDSQTTYW
jgi:hypothetical protein